MDEWLNKVWGDDAPLMKQAISEMNPPPHYCVKTGRKAELAYLVMKRFRELKNLAVAQPA